jgi:hypothetical protein
MQYILCVLIVCFLSRSHACLPRWFNKLAPSRISVPSSDVSGVNVLVPLTPKLMNARVWLPGDLYKLRSPMTFCLLLFHLGLQRGRDHVAEPIPFPALSGEGDRARVCPCAPVPCKSMGGAGWGRRRAAKGGSGERPDRDWASRARECSRRRFFASQIEIA